MCERAYIDGKIKRITSPMAEDTPEERERAIQVIRNKADSFVKNPQSLDVPFYVYYIADFKRKSIKIGHSRSPKARFYNLQISNCDKLEMLNTMKFKSRRIARDVESWLHKYFHAQISESMSEWFDSSILERLKSDFWTSEQILKAMEEER